MTTATLTVPQAAELLGITRNTAYAAVARDGQLAGVAAIRVGPKRIVIPRAPLLAVLGLDKELAERLDPA